MNPIIMPIGIIQAQIIETEYPNLLFKSTWNIETMIVIQIITNKDMNKIASLQ